MKKTFFLLLMFVFTGLLQPGIAVQARDVEGCLTCHQYPGLVRLEKNHGIRVLHVDEGKYMQAPHGKLACRTCHVGLDQFPHVGAPRVDCTCTCHQDAKQQALLKNYDHSTLHMAEQSFVSSLDDPSSCRVCHPPYPHSANIKVRALLNMHTGFMYCETCHIKRATFSDLQYEWAEPRYVQFVGEPFGSRYNPRADASADSGHLLARIGVFYNLNGTRRSLINTWDGRQANAFLAAQGNLSPEVRQRKLDFFHHDIAKKEISVACEECHSATSILDFEQLGFDHKKSEDLKHLNVTGLVSHYKTFYFPHLFDR